MLRLKQEKIYFFKKKLTISKIKTHINKKLQFNYSYI